jgi:hypothetical protein
VNDLLDNTGMTVLNRYSGLFWANHYSTDIIGRDDFRSVLEAVRERLETVERLVQEQIAQFEQAEQRDSG